jgi:hypothetical protein
MKGRTDICVPLARVGKPWVMNYCYLLNALHKATISVHKTNALRRLSLPLLYHLPNFGVNRNSDCVHAVRSDIQLPTYASLAGFTELFHVRWGLPLDKVSTLHWNAGPNHEPVRNALNV